MALSSSFNTTFRCSNMFQVVEIDSTPCNIVAQIYCQNLLVLHHHYTEVNFSRNIIEKLSLQLAPCNTTIKFLHNYITNTYKCKKRNHSYRLITGGPIGTGLEGTLDFFFLPSKRNPEPVNAFKHERRCVTYVKAKLTNKMTIENKQHTYDRNKHWGTTETVILTQLNLLLTRLSLLPLGYF